MTGHESYLRTRIKALQSQLMLPAKQHKAYCEFYDLVRNGEHLDARITAMIGLAAAMARECQPWIEHYLGVAREQNISNLEIGAIQGIVMAVSAGKINAMMRESASPDRE